MTIYIDLIILINFIIDFILLLSTAKLLKRNFKIKNILLSSLIGSTSTILLFIITNQFQITLYKLLTSIIMILITFKYNNFNYFKDNLIYLYILSITLGGTIYLLSNTITLNHNGLLFTPNGLKINIYILLIISPIILYKYITKQQHLTTEYQNYYNVEIHYNNKIIKETGFLDTGNNLKDPYFHKPIILINQTLIKDHIKTFLVPYYTINNKDLLEVFTPQKILINNHKTKPTLIGLTDVNINGIKIILNKESIWKKL